MKRKRPRPEEMIKKRREAATLLAGGQRVEAPRARNWKSACRPTTDGAGMRGAKEETVKRLKALEKENAPLKKLVANPARDLSILKEVAEGKWEARSAAAEIRTRL